MAGEFVHADVGGELTETEYHAILGHILDSQARGDIIVSNTLADGLIRLALGTQADDVLRVNAAETDLEWGARDLTPAIRAFFETANFYNPSSLGAGPQGVGAVANNTPVGDGWGVALTGTGFITTGTVTGAWIISTGATQNSDIGFCGPRTNVSLDWQMVGKIYFDPATEWATNDVGLWGAGPSVNDFSDANNMVALRKSGTGNVFGVCDSGGVETTRDYGVDGIAAIRARIKCSSSGTIVQFFANGTQLGADVTTNIHTSNLQHVIGLTNVSASSPRKMASVGVKTWNER